MPEAMTDGAAPLEPGELADAEAAVVRLPGPQDMENCFGPRSASVVADTARSSAPSRWRPPKWRRRVLSGITLGLIVGAIWYLQSGAQLPFISEHRATGSGLAVGGIKQDGQSGFVTFESQAIKLGAASGNGPKIGEPAPDFTLLDLNGQPVRLSDLRGKTVALNFWATWCPPCRQEFPLLVRAYNQNAAQGLVVLGVDVQESADLVRSFVDEFSATYPVVIDSAGDVGKRYRLVGLPTTWFIDPQGILRAQLLGPLTPGSITSKLAQAGFTTATNR